MKGLGTPKTQSSGNRQAVVIRHLREKLQAILNESTLAGITDDDADGTFTEITRLATEALKEAE